MIILIFVKKRDNTEVPFDKNKIIIAINKAFIEVDETLYETDTALDIANTIMHRAALLSEPIPVETIQDMIEEYLMTSERKDVARAYIRYRYKKEIIRQTNKTYNGILDLVEMQNKELIDENSNKDAIVASTQRDYMAGEVSKDLAHRVLLPAEVIRAHDAGEIHFHKLIVA